MWPDRAALAVRTDTPEYKCEGSSKEKPENGLGVSGRVVSSELRAGTEGAITEATCETGF